MGGWITHRTRMKRPSPSSDDDDDDELACEAELALAWFRHHHVRHMSDTPRVNAHGSDIST